MTAEKGSNLLPPTDTPIPSDQSIGPPCLIPSSLTHAPSAPNTHSHPAQSSVQTPSRTTTLPLTMQLHHSYIVPFTLSGFITDRSTPLTQLPPLPLRVYLLCDISLPQSTGHVQPRVFERQGSLVPVIVVSRLVALCTTLNKLLTWTVARKTRLLGRPQSVLFLELMRVMISDRSSVKLTLIKARIPGN